MVSIVKWALEIVKKLWVRPKKLEKRLRELGFNGNSYRFVYGDMKEFGEMRIEAKSKPIKLSDDIRPRVLPFHHHIINKFGNNSFIWFGAKPRLNIMEPVLVKEIYSRPYDFHKPYPDPVADLVVGGLLAAHAQKWTKHRKIISPAFHLEKLKCMLPAINLSCDDMIKKWEILVSTNGYAEVDVWPYLEDLSCDMISRAAFGSNLEEGRIIFQLHKEQTNLGFKMMGSSYTKAFRPWFFPPAKPDKRMIQIEGEIQAQIKRVINKREKATKIGEGNIDDLLSILMESNTKEIQEDDEGMRMSMEEVIDECKVFYTAGANSTSRLLVWTMIMLSAHPNWQTRAREEVVQVFGNKKLYFDGLNHLKIVTMILQEVLRLYPPTSMTIRAVSKKTKLGNMTIPPWVQLTLPIILHQYDPKTWGNDATEFKPERFSEGISNATCTKNSSSFLPFSGGPRICVGHNFAMMEAKIAIARILQRFPLIQLSPSYVHAPELFFLLRPQYGAKLILHN